MKKISKILSVSLLFFGFISTQTKALTNEENLTKIFSEIQIKHIKEYKTSFENIKSSEDFANTYHKALLLEKELSDPINRAYDKIKTDIPSEKEFKWIESFTPSMSIHLVAEATQLDLLIDYIPFQKKAKMTPQKEDDMFINLLIDVYGDGETDYAKWFKQTWDYGGCSHLGKGIHTKNLKDINSIFDKSKFFKKDLQEINDSIFRDLTKNNLFCEPKNNVIKEINQILKTIPLTKEQKNKINDRLKEFNKNKKEIEFNCNVKNCAYG